MFIHDLERGVKGGEEGLKTTLSVSSALFQRSLSDIDNLSQAAVSFTHIQRILGHQTEALAGA